MTGSGYISGRGGRSSQYDRQPDEDGEYEAEYDEYTTIPDSARLRFCNPPRTPFGNASRMGKVMDTEYMKSCPEAGYGESSPGFVYTPDDRKVRPGSAPSYSIRSGRGTGPNTSQRGSSCATPNTSQRGSSC